jgi:uncharacterized membrane protein YdjX (TVP38/TMEM64 family)
MAKPLKNANQPNLPGTGAAWGGEPNAANRAGRLSLRGLLGLGLLVLGLAAVLIFLYRAPLWAAILHYSSYVSTKEKIKDLLEACGPWAPLIFILIQSLQVVFAPVPGEATGFLGGFLFGVGPGLIYSTIGLTLGSLLAFLLGRWLEIHFVKRVVQPETLKKFDFLMERQGALISFILFLFPGFPKDYLCFILGVSPMHLKIFLLIVVVGRIPGTLLLTLQGAQVYEGNYLDFAIMLGVILLGGVALIYYRERFFQWLRRWGGCEYNRNSHEGK